MQISQIDKESFKFEEVEFKFSWYMIECDVFVELKSAIADIKVVVEENKLANSQLYFYTKIINGDAIGDKVRTTIMVAIDFDLNVTVNVNTADSMMAQHLGYFIELKNDLVRQLV